MVICRAWRWMSRIFVESGEEGYRDISNLLARPMFPPPRKEIKIKSSRNCLQTCAGRMPSYAKHVRLVRCFLHVIANFINMKVRNFYQREDERVPPWQHAMRTRKLVAYLRTRLFRIIRHWTLIELEKIKNKLKKSLKSFLISKESGLKIRIRPTKR